MLELICDIGKISVGTQWDYDIIRPTTILMFSIMTLHYINEGGALKPKCEKSY